MMNCDGDGGDDSDHACDDDDDGGDYDDGDGDDDENDDIDVVDNDGEAAIPGPREKRIMFRLTATKSKGFRWRSAFAGTTLRLRYFTSPSFQV